MEGSARIVLADQLDDRTVTWERYSGARLRRGYGEATARLRRGYGEA